MNTHQPVNNHDDLLKVVDGILAEAGINLKDFGGKVTFAGMDPIRLTVFKVGHHRRSLPRQIRAR